MKKLLTLIALACLLSMYASAKEYGIRDIFNPPVNTSYPSVRLFKSTGLIFGSGEFSWSIGYMYGTKTVLTISGKDSTLTVFDAKLAGKRLMEDQQKSFDEEKRNYQTIKAANELINYLLVKSHMSEKDSRKLDAMISNYSKILNQK